MEVLVCTVSVQTAVEVINSWTTVAFQRRNQQVELMVNWEVERGCKAGAQISLPEHMGGSVC